MPTTAAQPTSPNRGFALVVACVVVLGIGAIAVLATARAGDPDDDVGSTAAVEIVGEPLEQLPRNTPGGPIDPASDPMAGRQVPALTGTDFDGEEVAITADGRPKAVYLLAHWCSHCQAEVPVLKDLVASGAVPEGLDLYAVSTAVDEARPNYPPRAWLENAGLDVPLIRDDADSSAHRAYGGGAFPYLVLLDGDNRVVARATGELGPDVTTALWQAAVEATGNGPTGDSTDG